VNAVFKPTLPVVEEHARMADGLTVE